jgi:glycosyltransferase involved in cell wall biosynthesis
VIPAVSPKYGGPSHALVPMCRALIARGVDVQIASTDAEPGGHISLELQSQTSYEGVPAIFFRKNWSEAFKFSRTMANWLDRNVADFDVAHIHGVFSHACLSAARACQRARVPYLIRPLGNLDPWSLRQKPVRKKLFLNLCGKRMLRGAATVQYTSATEEKLSESALDLNHGVVIPLGVGLSSNVEPASSNGNFRAVAGSSRYVLVLSRLQPTKGIDVLIDAFVSLLKDESFRNWQLVIAGDGPPQYVASLKRKIEASQVSESFVLAGWLDAEAKACALRHASLLALPSYHENFGLCTVEAMSFGVPLLVSPHVSLAPEIEAAEAGWVAEVNKDSLEVALAEALGHDDERLRRGVAGRQLAEHFTWERIASQLINVYESVVRGASANRVREASVPPVCNPVK